MASKKPKKITGPVPKIAVEVYKDEWTSLLNLLEIKEAGKKKAAQEAIQSAVNNYASLWMHYQSNVLFASDMKADFEPIAKAAKKLRHALNQANASTLSFLDSRVWLYGKGDDIAPYNIVESLGDDLVDLDLYEKWLNKKPSMKGGETAHHVAKIRKECEQRLEDLYRKSASNATKIKKNKFVTECSEFVQRAVIG